MGGRRRDEVGDYGGGDCWGLGCRIPVLEDEDRTLQHWGLPHSRLQSGAGQHRTPRVCPGGPTGL